MEPPKVAPKCVRTAKSCLGQSRRRGQDCHWEVLGETLSQKSLFLEMYEKQKEKHGFSRVREGPGAQVGTTWAQKSRPRRVRTAKIISNRAAARVRAAKVRPVRLGRPSELWEPQVLSQTRTGSEVKVYLNDQSYD